MRFQRAPGARPLLYAHRGAHSRLPENTLGAFEQALAEGADGIELDVRMCKTGELVVFHDETLLRMAGRAEALQDLSFRDVGAVRLAGGAAIPTLDAVLDVAGAAGVLVNIEVKASFGDAHGYWHREYLTRRAAIAHATVQLMRRRRKAERAPWMFSTFDPLVFSVLRAGVDLPVAFLFDAEHTGVRRAAWGERLLRPRVLNPEKGLVTEGAMARWRAAGLVVNAWTVNDPSEAVRLAELGVDGLITDHVPVLRAHLDPPA